MNRWQTLAFAAITAADLLRRSQGDRISANYTAHDVTNSATARTRGISEQFNLPFSAKLLARHLARTVIEPANEFTGQRATPTSWWRSDELNMILPGAEVDSIHRTGRAVDLELWVDDQEQNALLARALLAGKNFDRLLIYGNLERPRFLHVEAPEPGKRPRNIVMRKIGPTWKRLDFDTALLIYG